MESTAPALGKAVSRHAYAPFVKASSFFWALVFILVPSFVIVTWLRRAASLGPAIGISLFPAAFVAMGIWMLRSSIRDAGLELAVHEHGLAVTRGGSTASYGWSAIRSITEKQRRRTAHLLVIAFEDGTTVEVDSQVSDYAQLKNLLRR